MNGDPLTTYAEKIVELSSFLSSLETDMLYVQLPSKYDGDASLLPPGTTDNRNERTDGFLQVLDDAGVSYMDLRDNIKEEGIHQYDLFFVTDHHWNPKGAFWGYTKVMEYLEKNHDVSVDSKGIDLVNFKDDVYKDWFLGSHGKRVGRYYAGVDDIDLLYPAFETTMSIDVPYKNIYRSGSFYDSVFALSNIKYVDYYGLDAYSVYVGGDYPLVIQKNKDAINDMRVLILKDSFVRPMQGYFSLQFSEISVIDLRTYTYSSLYQYIDYYSPDLVLVMYNPSGLRNKASTVFGSVKDVPENANYLLASEQKIAANPGTVKYAGGISPSIFLLDDASGRLLTFSADVALAGGNPSDDAGSVELILKYLDSNRQEAQLRFSLDASAAVTGRWTRFSNTLSLPVDVAEIIGVEWYAAGKKCVIHSRHAKLEISPSASKWCPAPEDDENYGINLLDPGDDGTMDKLTFMSPQTSYSMNIELYTDFLPETVYTFSIEGISVLEGDVKYVMVSMQDLGKNEAIQSQLLDVSTQGRKTWTFKTPKDTENVALLLFAGVAKFTFSKTIEAVGLRLDIGNRVFVK